MNPLRVYKMNDRGRIKSCIFPRLKGDMKLGRFTLANVEAEVLCWRWPKTVQIGKYSSIGKCTFVVNGNHNPSFASTYPFAEMLISNGAPQNDLEKDVPIVGNDVWIGDGAFIYSGVVIGDGAVIAGNSIVTRSVAPYAIVAGNTARVVKYRFDQDLIARYVQAKWWDLPDDVVASKLAPHLANPLKFVELAEEYTSI